MTVISHKWSKLAITTSVLDPKVKMVGVGDKKWIEESYTLRAKLSDIETALMISFCVIATVFLFEYQPYPSLPGLTKILASGGTGGIVLGLCLFVVFNMMRINVDNMVQHYTDDPDSSYGAAVVYLRIPVGAYFHALTAAVIWLLITSLSSDNISLPVFATGALVWFVSVLFVTIEDVCIPVVAYTSKDPD